MVRHRMKRHRTPPDKVSIRTSTRALPGLPGSLPHRRKVEAFSELLTLGGVDTLMVHGFGIARRVKNARVNHNIWELPQGLFDEVGLDPLAVLTARWPSVGLCNGHREGLSLKVSSRKLSDTLELLVVSGTLLGWELTHTEEPPVRQTRRLPRSTYLLGSQDVDAEHRAACSVVLDDVVSGVYDNLLYTETHWSAVPSVLDDDEVQHLRDPSELVREHASVRFLR